MGFKVSGTIEVEEVIEEETAWQAAMAFKAIHGVYPHTVGDNIVIGGCEGCKKPIFDGSSYAADEEGCLVCDTCTNAPVAPEGDYECDLSLS